jgi:Kef-type K+ transport system membrane component KefB
MEEKMLLVAIGCGRLFRILEIAVVHGFVVFGVVGGQTIAGLDNCPVYFYETG